MNVKKALIIGGAGFVGGHLIQYLCKNTDLQVHATKLYNEKIEESCLSNENVHIMDILNKEQVYQVIEQVKPDYIFHLAAQSSVSLSWKDPALTFNINVNGTVNVLEVVRFLNLNTRILLIGSAEQYGPVKEEELPIKESLTVRPSNPYAISKASQEMLASMYVESCGMDIIMARAFNHIGPGQSPVFVVSDFAKQIVEIEVGLRDPIIYVGNLEAKRDFTDVRDIVRAYLLLSKCGIKGSVYNVGSGNEISISEILYKFIHRSNVNIEVKVDKEKFRPIDVPIVKADISKIYTQIGWKPTITLDRTIEDTLNYWRLKLKAL